MSKRKKRKGTTARRPQVSRAAAAPAVPASAVSASATATTTAIGLPPVHAEVPPSDPVDALFAEAVGHHQNQALAEAEALYRRILVLRPTHADALNNLGIVLKANRRFDTAFATYRRAALVAANPVPVLNNLALGLHQVRRFDEAVQVCKWAAAVDPASVEAYFNIGNAMRAQGKVHAAIACFERAVRIAPDHAASHTNLGDAFRALGMGERSLFHSRRAAEIAPALMEPYTNMGDVLREHGRVREAIPCFAQAFANNPKHAAAHSNLLLALNYPAGRSGLENLKAHRFWGESHADPLTAAAAPHTNDRDPDRKLRVGFVSGDFRTHSVAYFLEPVIEKLDRSRFDVHCYSVTSQPDVATERFRAAAQVWRHDPSMDDAQLAEVVRQDGVDILIDVSGHTGNNRLLAFARKPAPVQATWLGYPNTTGMKAMDWRISDAVADPIGLTDSHHTERVLRLPGGFLVYRPLLSMTPPVEPTPALAKGGRVTFGSFNNISKVTPEVVVLWARVLQAVPNSDIVLKGMVFADPATRAFYLDLFRSHGVAPERVTLMQRIEPPDNHFTAYHRLDVALDTVPYNGTTTTCEALWMGVPVVTLMGDQHAGRVGASLLNQVGLGSLIGQDEDHYVRICAALAGNLPLLGHLRATMRDRLTRSPLLDDVTFARNFGLALRDMWREWCFGFAAAAPPVPQPALTA